MLSVSPEVLKEELISLRAIAHKWVDKVEGGIPGVSLPPNANSSADLVTYIKELYGELMICSKRCEVIATLLASDVEI